MASDPPTDDDPVVLPFCDAWTRMTAQEENVSMGGDGCCHKTRLKYAPCPVGWKCPYIAEAESNA